MGNTWVSNSFAYAANDSAEVRNWVVAGIAIGGFQLVHSAFIHKRKFGYVRQLTDMCSMSCFLASVLFYTQRKIPGGPSIAVNAVALDLFSLGIFTLLIQLADNYIFYIRYMAITNVSTLTKYIIHAYVIVVLSLTWLPTYTVVPFFYDVNSSEFIQVFSITLKFYSWGTFVYNLIFTYYYMEILYQIHFCGSTQFSREVTTLCYKTLIHFLISTSVAFICAEIIPTGFYINNVIVTLSLHFLFNFKVEKLFRPRGRIYAAAAAPAQIGASAVSDISIKPVPFIIRHRFIAVFRAGSRPGVEVAVEN